MIFEGIANKSTAAVMIRSSTSPAISEISVGSPSPPPVAAPSGTELFKSTQISNAADPEPLRHTSPSHLTRPPSRRKSSAERVKSFSIADILGRKDVQTSSNSNRLNNEENRQHLLLNVPSLTKIVRPWDPVRGPIPIRPLFAPVLLHYDQRIAWDYQRHLQEHFHAQAQLLRQMSMDPSIIPSEDGSERSRSSSVASGCGSPDMSNSIRINSDHKHSRELSGHNCSESDKISLSSIPNGQKPETSIPNDTPLNALFQLSTKNFDEEQGK